MRRVRDRHEIFLAAQHEVRAALGSKLDRLQRVIDRAFNAPPKQLTHETA
jgi:hypothetical protein